MDGDAVLSKIVELADALPGAFRAEVGLRYHAGGGPEQWQCEVEGDLLGDDSGIFAVWGRTPAEAVDRAVEA